MIVENDSFKEEPLRREKLIYMKVWKDKKEALEPNSLSKPSAEEEIGLGLPYGKT